MDKNNRGRPKGVPNKMCGNCKYWAGERNFKKGFVYLDSCLKKDQGIKVTNTHYCDNYVLEETAKIPNKYRKKSLLENFLVKLLKMELFEYRLYLRKKNNQRKNNLHKLS
jgi:hypothetical protein